ncbi:hypothetical protein DFH08DRAFT_971650 [Mycena albidolilacea]|uniref:Uncharacterized protein n=1 Tax=Mycena albidolilacea TaxID=1033008 RepID=A0AAD6ZCT5_9AGAR|nr:hypothetical protein DFH08DRAFT_971650 [Mycena albidolilacea]
MSSCDLKSQLHVYCDLLKDGVLGKILWKNMATVAVHRELVLEAREREITRHGQDTSKIIPEAVSTDKDIVADEFGYSVDEEEEWQGIAEELNFKLIYFCTNGVLFLDGPDRNQ